LLARATAAEKRELLKSASGFWAALEHKPSYPPVYEFVFKYLKDAS
jgi:hypothetical protein